ncbi:hypothetical protein HDU96_005870 [Phlyctochytrium bullatum]|nr:hypothetical protein HDU96_005870 [Phlyctochytrium bullatum]
MNASAMEQSPILVLSYDRHQGVIEVMQPDNIQRHWTRHELQDHVYRTILDAFRHTSETNPDRFIFALAGRLFHPNSPYPVGGKKNPGYLNYRGEKARDLLTWIASQIIIPPVLGRGHRSVEPGTCLRYCVDRVNEILGWERMGNKDDLDNAVLGGLAKTNQWERGSNGQLLIPKQYRDGAKPTPSSASSPTMAPSTLSSGSGTSESSPAGYKERLPRGSIESSKPGWGYTQPPYADAYVPPSAYPYSYLYGYDHRYSSPVSSIQQAPKPNSPLCFRKQYPPMYAPPSPYGYDAYSYPYDAPRSLAGVPHGHPAASPYSMPPRSSSYGKMPSGYDAPGHRYSPYPSPVEALPPPPPPMADRVGRMRGGSVSGGKIGLPSLRDALRAKQMSPTLLLKPLQLQQHQPPAVST